MSRSILATYATPVLPEWIDYNGHLNVAYYMLVFDRGTDGLFDLLEIGAAYRRAGGHTIYALEAHLSYLRELRLGDPLRVTTQLVAADAKRLRVFHRMEHESEGFLAATCELMCLHVDPSGPRAVAFPPAAKERIDRLLEEHRALPVPEQLGRSIAMSPLRL
jgi:acyl-CoA thioester hydrolase